MSRVLLLVLPGEAHDINTGTLYGDEICLNAPTGM